MCDSAFTVNIHVRINLLYTIIPLDHHYITYAVMDAHQHTLQLHSYTRDFHSLLLATITIAITDGVEEGETSLV